MCSGPVGFADTNSRLIDAARERVAVPVARPRVDDRLRERARRRGIQPDVDEARTGDLGARDAVDAGEAAASSVAISRGFEPSGFATRIAMLEAQSPCSRSLGRSSVTCSGVRSSDDLVARRPTSLDEAVHEVEQGTREVVGSHPQILPGAVDRVRHMPRPTHPSPHPFRRPRAPRRGIRRLLAGCAPDPAGPADAGGADGRAGLADGRRPSPPRRPRSPCRSRSRATRC